MPVRGQKQKAKTETEIYSLLVFLKEYKIICFFQFFKIFMSAGLSAWLSASPKNLGLRIVTIRQLHKIVTQLNNCTLNGKE